MLILVMDSNGRQIYHLFFFFFVVVVVVVVGES